MKFIEKTKGAVSLFLVIVLLPVLSFAGVFIDLARVEVAQESVVSAADLALNTVLSKYDSQLKDYFGLFGSAQDMDDVIGVAKQYFKDCMISAGVDTSEAGEYADNIADAFLGDDDIRDMLQLSVDGEVSIKPVKNSGLDNPAMLKKGVIEFMKYRAPINKVADLFSSITDADIEEQMNNVSKEATMTEKKKKFYEAEEELLKQAKKAYKAIEEYKNYTTWTGKKIGDESFLNDLSNFLEKPDGSNDFETIYKDAHRRMTKDLYTTHDSNENLIALIKPKYYTKNWTNKTYSDSKQATEKQVKSALTLYNSALNNYYNKRSALGTAWESVGARKNSDYNIQYWVVLTNKCSKAYSEYVSAASNVIKRSVAVKNAVTYAKEGVMDAKVYYTKYSNSKVSYTRDSSGNVTLQEVYDKLTGLGYESQAKNGGSPSYKNVTNQAYSLSNNSTIAQNLRTDNVKEIYNIRNKVNKYCKDFESAANLAKTAKEETNKLTSLLQKYKKAFKAWDTAANDAELNDSELACGGTDSNGNTFKGDRQVIAELKKTGIEHFSEKAVTELVDRLKNIETALDTFKKDLKNIKYNGTPIINISSYSKFYSACKLSKSKIVRNNGQLDEYAKTSFSFSIGEQIQRVEIYDRDVSQFDGGTYYAIGNNTHFDITKKQPELYTWMVKTFSGKKPNVTLNESTHGFNVSDEGSADKADEAIDKKSEDTSNVETGESLKGKNFSEWKGSALPSAGNFEDVEATKITTKLTEVANFTKDIFSNFSGTFKNSLVKMRDDLFMLDYTMNMFTYDTFEKEICYSMLSESQQKGLTPIEAKDLYPSKDWSTADEAKTLTLTPKNSKNNWAYGGEVEYILYGSGTNALNKGKAYGNIFLIRYALNIAPVFKAYENDFVVQAVARALELWAHIPAKLTTTIICLAITAAEAATDISYLRWGIPVFLIKNENQIVCSYEKVFTGGADKGVADQKGIKLQYTDYIMIFMYIKLLGSEENNLYLRMGDVIQANMSLYGDSKYSLSKAKVYYSLKADVTVAPMWSNILAISDMGDLSSAENWRKININISRGY